MGKPDSLGMNMPLRCPVICSRNSDSHDEKSAIDSIKVTKIVTNCRVSAPDLDRTLPKSVTYVTIVGSTAAENTKNLALRHVVHKLLSPKRDTMERRHERPNEEED